MLAALCVSKMRPGIPARGFFLAVQDLGVFTGDPRARRRVPSMQSSCSVCLHSMEDRVRIWCS
jgi:hypothetical protein